MADPQTPGLISVLCSSTDCTICQGLCSDNPRDGPFEGTRRQDRGDGTGTSCISRATSRIWSTGGTHRRLSGGNRRRHAGGILSQAGRSDEQGKDSVYRTRYSRTARQTFGGRATAPVRFSSSLPASLDHRRCYAWWWLPITSKLAGRAAAAAAAEGVKRSGWSWAGRGPSW